MVVTDRFHCIWSYCICYPSNISFTRKLGLSSSYVIDSRHVAVKYGTILINIDCVLIKDSLYLALRGEQWGVFNGVRVERYRECTVFSYSHTLAGMVYSAPGITDRSRPLVEDKDCTTTRKGHSYDGYTNTTLTGRICQRWDQDTPQVNEVSSCWNIVGKNKNVVS